MRTHGGLRSRCETGGGSCARQPGEPLRDLICGPSVEQCGAQILYATVAAAWTANQVPRVPPGAKRIPSIRAAYIEVGSEALHTARTAYEAPMDQQTLLRDAMRGLAATRKAFAERLGVTPRALDTWLLPAGSRQHRAMPEVV